MLWTCEAAWTGCLWDWQRADLLDGILLLLDQQGVRYRLVRGVMRVSEQTEPSDEMQAVVDAFRDRLSRLLRRRSCLCEDCGLQPACAPRREGTRWCGGCYRARVGPITERLTQSKNLRADRTGTDEEEEETDMELQLDDRAQARTEASSEGRAVRVQGEEVNVP